MASPELGQLERVARVSSPIDNLKPDTLQGPRRKDNDSEVLEELAEDGLKSEPEPDEIDIESFRRILEAPLLARQIQLKRFPVSLRTLTSLETFIEQIEKHIESVGGSK